MPIPRPRSPAGRVVRHIIHHWSSGQFAETNTRACMSGFVVAQPSGRENQARVGGSYRRGQWGRGETAQAASTAMGLPAACCAPAVGQAAKSGSWPRVDFRGRVRLGCRGQGGRPWPIVKEGPPFAEVSW